MVIQAAADRQSSLEAASPSADLGVLFVHGIGNQGRGETLVTMGESLYGWLRAWGRSSVRPFNVDVSHAELTEPPGVTPAWARVVTLDGPDRLEVVTAPLGDHWVVVGVGHA